MAPSINKVRTWSQCVTWSSAIATTRASSYGSFAMRWSAIKWTLAYSAGRLPSAALSVDRTRALTANRHGRSALGAPRRARLLSQAKTRRSRPFTNGRPTSRPSSRVLLVLPRRQPAHAERSRAAKPGISEENTYEAADHSAGSLGVWTLMDLGEPHGTGTSSWPFVACTILGSLTSPASPNRTRTGMRRSGCRRCPSGRRTAAALLQRVPSLAFSTCAT